MTICYYKVKCGSRYKDLIVISWLKSWCLDPDWIGSKFSSSAVILYTQSQWLSAQDASLELADSWNVLFLRRPLS